MLKLEIKGIDIFNPLSDSKKVQAIIDSLIEVMGEELRQEIEKRIKEAEKLGFKSCIIPESNKKVLKDTYKLDIIGVANIADAMKAAFER